MVDIHCPLAFIGDLLTPTHMFCILVIGLLVFGKRLPEVAKSLGKSFSEFKKGLLEGQNELNAMTSEKPPAPSTPSAPPTDHTDKPA
jgi:sec-independent protein translocase protein TatA